MYYKSMKIRQLLAKVKQVNYFEYLCRNIV